MWLHDKKCGLLILWLGSSLPNMYVRTQKFVDAKTADDRLYYGTLVRAELKQRKMIDETFFSLVKHVTGLVNNDDIYAVLKSYHRPKNFKCLKHSYKTFEESCFAFNDYSMKYVQTLVNLCESYSNAQDLTETIRDECNV